MFTVFALRVFLLILYMSLVLCVDIQDLLRRMLKLDPNERASIPEIFNHAWLRFRNVTSLDNQVGQKPQRSVSFSVSPLPAPTPRHAPARASPRFAANVPIFSSLIDGRLPRKHSKQP